jgi:putative transposase
VFDQVRCPDCSSFRFFVTDQGSQFTSNAWTGALREAGFRVSMDGKGNWTDNVYTDRLWRSMKYKCA